MYGNLIPRGKEVKGDTNREREEGRFFDSQFFRPHGVIWNVASRSLESEYGDKSRLYLSGVPVQVDIIRIGSKRRILRELWRSVGTREESGGDEESSSPLRNRDGYVHF